MNRSNGNYERHDPERFYDDEPDCAFRDSQHPFELSEREKDVKITANNLITLSEKIGIDADSKILQILPESSFSSDVVRNHINKWNKCI